MNAIKYKQHHWQLCGDLKVIMLLLGLQGVFTKYCCFLCLWDSQATEHHCDVMDWSVTAKFVPKESNTNTVKPLPISSVCIIFPQVSFIFPVPIYCPYKQCIITSDASFLDMSFYHVNRSEFLVLAHNIPGKIVSEKKK
jgi:hypothetical protein